MPCRDYESDDVSPTDSWQYRDLKERADMLARIACKAMTELEDNRIEDLLLLRDDEVREWWAKHKEADRKAREKEQRKQERIRLRRAALRKLSEEEKIALGLKKSKDKDIEEDVVEFINELWLYRPHKFKFADNGYGHSDPYGDDTFQTPLWIRPKSLMEACQDVKKTMIQVVGHTAVKQIDAKGKATGGRYYFIDCLDYTPEYLVYEDKQVKINKL